MLAVKVKDKDKDEVTEITPYLVTKVTKAIQKAKLKGLIEEPFIAAVLLGMEVIVATHTSYGRKIKTGATCGRFLYVNPFFWAGLTEGQKVTLVVHEAWHVALAHHLRRGDRNQYWWNVAGDYRINLILKEAGFEPLPNWLYKDCYIGWSEERIYPLVFKPKPVNPPPPKPPKGEAEDIEESDEPCDEYEDEDDDDTGIDGGQPGDDESDKPGDEPGNEPDEEPGGSGGADGDDESDENSGGGGGSGSNKPEPSDDLHEPNEPELIGEVWDAADENGKELTEEEKKDELVSIKEDLQMAKNMERITSGEGTRASTERAVADMTTPRVAWGNRILRFLKSTGTPYGRAWTRLDRRSLANGIYQPAEIKEGIDWLVCMFDVSGSIDYRECRAFCSTMNSIRKILKIKRMTIVPFNEIVQQENIIELREQDKVPNKFLVGGGTSFAPTFNWIRRQSGTPDGIIIFTDLGDDNYGVQPKGIPLMWASSVPVWDEGTYSNRPPFGEIVEVTVEN